MNAHIASPTDGSLSRTARFVVAVTAAAAIAAWFLASVAKLSEEAVVLSIMVVAFIASWTVTNSRAQAPRSHRVTVVRARARAR